MPSYGRGMPRPCDGKDALAPTRFRGRSGNAAERFGVLFHYTIFPSTGLELLIIPVLLLCAGRF